MSAIDERLESLRLAFGQLSPRERVMVSVGAAALLLTLVYLLAWQPLVKAHTQRAQALERARSIATRIEQAGVQLRARGSASNVDRSTSLLAAVDQTSRSPVLGTAPSRVQPEGDREVRVWIDNVAFANLLRWLRDLEARYGIRAVSAEIERTATPGAVNARISLVRD
jgi:general secretion pathway protein M